MYFKRQVYIHTECNWSHRWWLISSLFRLCMCSFSLLFTDCFRADTVSQLKISVCWTCTRCIMHIIVRMFVYPRGYHNHRLYFYSSYNSISGHLFLILTNSIFLCFFCINHDTNHGATVLFVSFHGFYKLLPLRSFNMKRSCT